MVKVCLLSVLVFLRPCDAAFVLPLHPRPWGMFVGAGRIIEV
jgi:hypothetical protein